MNVEIAQRLAELRRARGFSQEGLAAELGLSRQAVSKWERAESAPDMGNLMALADLYGVTIDELLRVDADIADDVRFECQDRRDSTEARAEQAAEAAQDAAARAESAAASAEAGLAAAREAAARVDAAPASPAGAYEWRPPEAPAPASVGAVPAAGATQAGAAGFAPEAGAGFAGQPASGAAVPPPWGTVPPAAPPQAPGPVPGAVPPVAPLPKSPLRSFPYPLLCVVLFLLGGFTVGFGYTWPIFLTIPFWYWVVSTVEADPEYRAHREERYRAAQRTAVQPPAGTVPPQDR